MSKNDTEITSAMRQALAERVGQERFELWFGAKTRFTLREGVLRIEVPNRFFQDWLRSHFRSEIEAVCSETLGKSVALEFRIDAALENQPAPVGQKESPKKESLIPQPDSKPPDTKNPNPSTHGRIGRRFAKLESFVVGASNRLAYTSAQIAVERPGSVSPMVFYGPTGVGKTHLLEGVWTAVKKSQHATRVVYLTAEQFTTYFLSALHGTGLPSFRRKYRGVELLLIDDVQFFAGKRATVIELLYTIDTLLQEGRQLVLAANRPPDELTGLGPELIARLSGGLVCRMDPPEHQTRLGIVRQIAKKLEINVPEDVQQLIASHLTSNARELSGALNRLHATRIALGQSINLPMARQALSEMIRHSGRMVLLPDIEKAVCEAFGIESSSLQSGRKSRAVSHPRMLAMWLARKHTRAALSEIGHFFGRRTHSTVISAQKKVKRWMTDGSSLQLAGKTWTADEAIRHVEQNLRVS